MKVQCGFCNKFFESKYTETERRDINKKLANAESSIRALHICKKCWDKVTKTFGKAVWSNQN